MVNERMCISCMSKGEHSLHQCPECNSYICQRSNLSDILIEQEESIMQSQAVNRQYCTKTHIGECKYIKKLRLALSEFVAGETDFDVEKADHTHEKER